jgi:hypothetical protein
VKQNSSSKYTGYNYKKRQSFADNESQQSQKSLSTAVDSMSDAKSGYCAVTVERKQSKDSVSTYKKYMARCQNYPVESPSYKRQDSYNPV